MNKVEEIKKLKSLLDQGAITENEFISLKKLMLEEDEKVKFDIQIPPHSIGTIKEDSFESLTSNFTDSTSTQNKFTSVLTQERIDMLVATTDEFWKSFHESLVLPYSNYNNYKGETFDTWIKRVSKTPDLTSHLDVLFEYVLLKGEFLIVFFQGFILTNYRLIINDTSAGMPSIPLSNLKKYGCKIVYEKNGQSLILRYDSYLLETFVEAAKARFMEVRLNEVQMELISKSREEIKFNNPDLKIPKVEFNPKSSVITTNTNFQHEFKKSKSSNTPFSFQKIAIFIGIAVLLWFTGSAVLHSSKNCDDNQFEYQDGFAAGKLTKIMGGFGSCKDYVKSYNYETGRNTLHATDCYCEGFKDGLNGKPEKY